MTTLEQVIAETSPADAWPAGLGDHLSATQLTMFQRCPEQWRRRYLHGELQRPGAALVWGSADHYAHEQNFRQKILSGTDIATGDVQIAFAEGFDQAVYRNGGEREVEWGDDKPAELKDKGVELVAAYHTTVSPSVQPTAVEERFEVRLPGVQPLLVGYVDVRTDTTAIERKTAARAQKTIKPDWRIQGLLYQSVERLPVDWHVSVKTKTPAVYTPTSDTGLRLPYSPRLVDATQVLVKNLTQAILAYWRMFGPDQPWPGAITHTWACDFCGYRPSCAWWVNGE